MSQHVRAPLIAVLGPTNTGKTHLAVERMCAHSSGMIGFPLRLLAREIYDRIVAIKGVGQVALVTGEERIVPRDARWFCCTAESMPRERDFAFVALDEVQLASDPERGHIFTDRMLNLRGREETMLLGSATMTPMVRALLPDAEIISRPRFSTLSYAGAKKLSRLPKRSAVVAFSVEEVYAVAEMLRRHRGGAAVVMGALSPATRNAQVAMFMNGDVDYLVATDAIGMGLNLDVAHVAFASLRKFDGRRTRRLTVSEMAQIAGRAGRHHRDGTFGSVGAEDGSNAFEPEEVLAIEEHRFPPIQQIYWREGDPDLSSVDALINDLERRPDRPELRAAPEASDLAVLKYMADDPVVRQRVRTAAHVARLWDACGLPDFQKLGADHHARLVSRVWHFLSEGDGHVPRDWFAQSIARLDIMSGDIDTLSGRIAAVRSWCYIAQRPNWLAHPEEMAERTRDLEARLSDALHGALRQRFVDRRTSVLLRDIGVNRDDLPVELLADGTVQVDGETIGHLHGLRFQVDSRARGHDRKMLLAAAERRLGKMLVQTAETLIAAGPSELALDQRPGFAPHITADAAQGGSVATLAAGSSLMKPDIRVDDAIVALGQDVHKRVGEAIQRWFAGQLERHLTPLVKMQEQAEQLETPAPVRAFLTRLVDAGGVLARSELDDALTLLDKDQRQLIRRSGIIIGVLDIYHPGLLKPGAALWRMALISARRGKPMLPLPAAGAVLLKLEAREEQMGARVAGYRGIGDAQLRIDMIERVARGAHEAIAKNERFDMTSPLIVSLGLSEPQFLALMRNAGFRPVSPRGHEAAAVAAGDGDNDTPNEFPTEHPPEAPPEQPAETPPITEPEGVPFNEPAETPVEQPTELPPPMEAPGETGPQVGEALIAAGDGETTAVAAPPAGANWAFRGRPKPRVFDRNTPRRDATRDDKSRNASGGPRRSDDSASERRAAGRHEGKPRGKGPREGRGDAPSSRFARTVTAGPDKPVGGGAFAGLAELLGRKE